MGTTLLKEKRIRMKKYKLAIIGSGSLGSIIARVVSKQMHDEYEILGVQSGR